MLDGGTVAVKAACPKVGCTSGFTTLDSDYDYDTYSRSSRAGSRPQNASEAASSQPRRRAAARPSRRGDHTASCSAQGPPQEGARRLGLPGKGHGYFRPGPDRSQTGEAIHVSGWTKEFFRYILRDQSLPRRPDSDAIVL